MVEAEFTLPAVDCDGCFRGIEMVSRIEKGIIAVKGVKGSQLVVITWDEAETNRDSVVSWLTRIGYEPAGSVN